MSKKTAAQSIDHELKIFRWMNFGGDVPKYFDEHVPKSVPNYTRVMHKIGFISQFFIENGARYLDIGSSTGRTVLEVVYANRGKSLEVDMVDSEPDMVRVLKSRYKDRTNPRVSYHVHNFDITKFFFVAKYDLIVASLVVQFIKRELREELLRNIFQSLNNGGAFLWFEKCAELPPNSNYEETGICPSCKDGCEWVEVPPEPCLNEAAKEGK